MRLPALIILVLPLRAAAEPLWCGTFANEHGWLYLGPSIAVTLAGLRVDGRGDSPLRVRLPAELELDLCLVARDVVGGATWHVELSVAPNGQVVAASVTGDTRGARCVLDRVAALRFERALRPRTVSLTLSARPNETYIDR